MALVPVFIQNEQQQVNIGRIAAVNNFLQRYATFWGKPMPSIGPKGRLIMIQPEQNPYTPADQLLMHGDGAIAWIQLATTAEATLSQQSPDMIQFLPSGPPEGFQFAQPATPDGTMFLQQSDGAGGWVTVLPTDKGIAQATACGIPIPSNLIQHGS